MNRLLNLSIKRCPLCGKMTRSRTQRARKWKVLPMGRTYSCRYCHSHYIKIFRTFCLLTERGHIPSGRPKSAPGNPFGTSNHIVFSAEFASGTKHTKLKNNAHKTKIIPA